MKKRVSSTFSLAKLEETVRISSDMERIVDWVGVLRALSLPDVEYFYPPNIELKKRNDLVIEFTDNKSLVSLAPSFEDGFFKVPRVI